GCRRHRCRSPGCEWALRASHCARVSRVCRSADDSGGRMAMTVNSAPRLWNPLGAVRFLCKEQPQAALMPCEAGSSRHEGPMTVEWCKIKPTGWRGLNTEGDFVADATDRTQASGPIGETRWTCVTR